MGGFTGIDWVNAKALAGSDNIVAWERLVPLLRDIESGAMAGMARAAAEKKQASGDS